VPQNLPKKKKKMLDPLSFKTIEDEDESFDFEQEEESSEEFNLEFDENSTSAIPKVASESECSSESESDGSYEENEFNEEKDGEIEIEEEERKIIEQEDILKIKKLEKRKREYFEEVESNEIDAFTSLSLSRPILKAVASMGYTKPTAIQSQAIPVALQGRDICGSAVTGSGKTAAFMIPILERLLFRPKSFAAIRVLVLVPTRELGSQCHEVTMNLSKFSEISVCLCVGGLSNKSQEVELKKKPDIIIATPGRLIDHIHNSSSFSLDQLEILVIDEADRILEDGFKDELDEIIKHTPRKRQTMLFSATMTDNVDELIKLSLTRPVRLFVDDSAKMTNKLVQEFIRVRSHREDTRPAILVSLCTRTYRKETIIFFRSKAAAHHMKIIFELMGMKAAELHGNLTQPQVIIF
jgi:ATP-dependent RNA helicase DDX27